MRLLADENFPLPTVEALRLAGHDVFWVRTDAPGTGDAALLELAEADGRVLLTLDKDFWQIAIQRRRPLERSGVILFRVHPAIPENVHSAGAPHYGNRPGMERARQRRYQGSRADGFAQNAQKALIGQVDALADCIPRAGLSR
jgi:predicted nuclease of predicted toxin-antitoxin system